MCEGSSKRRPRELYCKGLMRESESRGTVENRHDCREAALCLAEVMSHDTGSLKTRIVLSRYWNPRRTPAYSGNRGGQNMAVDTVTKSSECRNWNPNLVVQNEKMEKKRLRNEKKRARYQANKEAIRQNTGKAAVKAKEAVVHVRE